MTTTQSHSTDKFKPTYNDNHSKVPSLSLLSLIHLSIFPSFLFSLSLRSSPPMADDPSTFSKLSDDVVLKIFFQLEDDPRNWARLSCVCRKFSSLISTICCKSKCLTAFPAISADLLSLSTSSTPDSWAALHKLAVCCPGLLHAGVLLDNSDFGLYRELGSDYDFDLPRPSPDPPSVIPTQIQNTDGPGPGDFGGWSLYDDLYFDTIYNNSETQDDDSSLPGPSPIDAVATPHAVFDSKLVGTTATTLNNDGGPGGNKKGKVARRPHRAHLASGAWNLSREQGNKLLASRFRGDCLYICDWPGCVHLEEKRNYMLFRGFFKNFKRSRVWRTINDGNRSKIDLNCAFCGCKQIWDLHSAFCLKRGFGYHDDGEPVVRAYVCENGHVSGAWTDQPLYT